MPTTHKGRVVYDRKRHDFKWKDAWRIQRKIGYEFLDQYLIPLPPRVDDYHREAMRQFMFVIDMWHDLSLYIGSTIEAAGGIWPWQALKAWYDLLPDDDKNLLRGLPALFNENYTEAVKPLVSLFEKLLKL